MAQLFANLRLRKFLPFIVCSSLAFNIFFITFTSHRSSTRSSQPSKPSEMTWPTAIGSFRVFFNYVPSVLKFNYTESVTFSTHATPEFLYHLEELISRWRGPVSIAVYVPGSDFELAVRTIRYLHQCAGELIRYYVSFHLFFKQEEFDDTSGRKQFPTYDASTIDCLLESITQLAAQTFRHKQNITYPVNVARNIARVLSSTHYVLTCDLELYPSLNFIPMFLQMIQRMSKMKDIIKANTRHVYVLPVYEMERNYTIPTNKQQLVRLLRANAAVSFHRYLCKSCHQIPSEEKWLNASSNNSLEVFAVARTRQRWEPIFVGTNNDPLYNEGLSWEGMNDKMSHMYEMCLMGYKLLILDDAFLIHAPGIKKSMHENYAWRAESVKDQQKVILKMKAEIDARHTSKPECKF